MALHAGTDVTVTNLGGIWVADRTLVDPDRRFYPTKDNIAYIPPLDVILNSVRCACCAVRAVAVTLCMLCWARVLGKPRREGLPAAGGVQPISARPSRRFDPPARRAPLPLISCPPCRRSSLVVSGTSRPSPATWAPARRWRCRA